MVSFFTSLGFLFAAQCNKDTHPTNLYCLLGFTLAMSWSVGVTCALYAAHGLGFVVIEAVGLTASVTAALTAYTLRSKKDFSFLEAGLGTSLWVLIFGGLIASLTGMAAMHTALAVGGAAIFSLYIVYDVFEISQRLSPDEYITAAISLYLDIIVRLPASRSLLTRPFVPSATCPRARATPLTRLLAKFANAEPLPAHSSHPRGDAAARLS